MQNTHARTEEPQVEYVQRQSTTPSGWLSSLSGSGHGTPLGCFTLTDISPASSLFSAIFSRHPRILCFAITQLIVLATNVRGCLYVGCLAG